MSKVRPLPIAVVAALVAAWCTAQLVLTNRIAASYRGHVFPLPNAVQLVEPCWVALVALTLLAAALVLGGRGRWVYLVAGMPAAYVVGWFRDGEPLGVGWVQNSPDMRTWLAVGTAVDTVLLLTIATLLLRALPQRHARMPGQAALTRVVPVLVVLVGWWATHRDYGDPENQVWITQAAVAVVVVALLAGSGLPLFARLAAIVVLPILAYPTTANSVIHRIDGMQMVHHVLFLAATAAYVAGVPWLVGRVKRMRTPLIAAESARSAS